MFMNYSTRSLLIACSLTLAACPIVSSRAAQVKFERPFAPAAHGVVHESERPYREEICLNGRWDFQAVPVPSGYVRMTGKPPALPDPQPDAWDQVPIKIPSPWNVNAFQKYPGVIPNAADYRYYPSYPEAWEKVEMAWMRKRFTVPGDWAGRDIHLHFEAVAGECEVRVNGKYLHRNFSLNLPFEVDVTESVRLGQENEILVGVRRDTLFYHQGMGGYRPLPSNTFWGWECAGIWQDVSLVALPPTRLVDVFVQPLVNEDKLVIEARIEGSAADGAEVEWAVYRWVPPAPTTDPVIRPEQIGKLDNKPVLACAPARVGSRHPAMVNMELPVRGALDLWWPENPNLYGVAVDLKRDGKILDRKYVRFGWRQYGFVGNKFTVNGRPTRLRCDAIHFMGISDMSRRQVFAYFQTLRDTHVNLARSTIQIRPRVFYEVADEVGMMVLAESGIWADYAIHQDDIWKRFHEECTGMVARDRNHPCIVGWSVENEFFASLQAQGVSAAAQADAARRWEPIIRAVQTLDRTRPWVSADGEGQTWPAGTFRPPVPIAHYGDRERYTWYHKNYGENDIPWGITESTDQYWLMPDSYEATVGDRVYDTLTAKMEGVGWLIYDTLANVQESLNGFVTAVYNVTWYGLKPLPIGQADTSRAPTDQDGVWLAPYREGEFGVQPERLGPYSVQFNPGYDPALPLYDPWPSFYAQQAAYAPGGPAPYPKPRKESRPPLSAVPVSAREVALVDGPGGLLRAGLAYAGIQVDPGPNSSTPQLLVVDTASLSEVELLGVAPLWQKTLAAGGTVYVSGVKPETLLALNQLLPAPLQLNGRTSVSVVPNREHPLLGGVPSAAGYFASPHGGGKIIMDHGLEGEFVREGKVWFQAPEVDWRQWGVHLPELQRTVSVLRGEREVKPSGVALAEHPAGKGRILVSTLSSQFETKRHVEFLRLLFGRMGSAVQVPLNRENGLLDENGGVLKSLKIGPFTGNSYAEVMTTRFVNETSCRPRAGDKAGDNAWCPIQNQGPTLGFVLDPTGANGFSASYVSFWIYSPLANEIVQNPYGSKVTLNIGADDGYQLWVNGSLVAQSSVSGSFASEFELVKGWNQVLLKVSNAGGPSGTILSIKSSNAFLMDQIKTVADAPPQEAGS
jgi:beta-galactosidase